MKIEHSYHPTQTFTFFQAKTSKELSWRSYFSPRITSYLMDLFHKDVNTDYTLICSSASQTLYMNHLGILLKCRFKRCPVESRTEAFLTRSQWYQCGSSVEHTFSREDEQNSPSLSLTTGITSVCLLSGPFPNLHEFLMINTKYLNDNCDNTYLFFI